jgi:HEAT repeat protein
LAVSSTAPGTLFIGTESMGLLRSNDRGASWQVVNSPELILGGAGALSVTALAIHPDDEQVMVAATGVWLGSTSAQLAPLGIFVSADGGREWFMAARAPLGAPVVNSLRPAAGSPATFVVETADGSHTLQVALNADLLSALDAASPARRAAAARIIGLTGDAAALPALTARLEDSDPLAGDRIVEAATRLGGNEVSGSLRALLASDDEALQARAAYGLGLLKDETSVTALGATLAHGGPMAARRAAEALAAIGTPEAVAKLIEPLAIPEMTPARHAAQAGLEQAGKPAVEPLAAALTSNDPIMRTHAAEALGWLKPIAATEALATALSDPDRNVRTEAAWALGELATGEARTALAKAIRSEDEATRSAAEAALARADRLTGNGAEMKPGGALLATLAQAGTARWTLLGLTLALAAALVFARPVAQMRLHGR